MIAIMLARKGFRVSIYDKRPDPRQAGLTNGRSINLALSERGWRALQGVGLAEAVREVAIPMHGRLMHDEQGQLTYQAYGQPGQCIYSISRAHLNQILLEASENENIGLYFGQECTSVNLDAGMMTMLSRSSGEYQTIASDTMIGADGVFSAVRYAMQRKSHFNYGQHYLDYGYRELLIPARSPGGEALDRNVLHIWPRNDFMCIALPNPDGSFTGTLFMPYRGATGFETICTPQAADLFFSTYFPDLMRYMPDVADVYHAGVTAPLLTVHCYPWCYKDKALLMGDASHGIVPFYGQGMNVGFEDCLILSQLVDQYGDWQTACTHYQQTRKPDADAIAELSLQNFLEMRHLVRDAAFLLRKKIERHLSKHHPGLWTPLYAMVAFSNQPFSEVLAVSKRQDAVMDRIMQTENIEGAWKSLDYRCILEEATQAEKNYSL